MENVPYGAVNLAIFLQLAIRPLRQVAYYYVTSCNISPNNAKSRRLV